MLARRQCASLLRSDPGPCAARYRGIVSRPCSVLFQSVVRPVGRICVVVNGTERKVLAHLGRILIDEPLNPLALCRVIASRVRAMWHDDDSNVIGIFGPAY